MGAMDLSENMDLFKEPEGYFKEPDPPRLTVYERNPECVLPNQPSTVQLRLPGQHPLWAHFLWNAGIEMAKYLDRNGEQLCCNKNVIELGAGAALPAMIAALQGAKTVAITDYPEAELLDNIQQNIDSIKSSVPATNLLCKGLLWGAPATDLLEDCKVTDEKFDLILLSDLIFNHSQHRQLLQTCKDLISDSNKNAQVLVFFSHHRPHVSDRDLAFFELAQHEYAFQVEKFDTKVYKPMFEKDFGPEEVRSTVHLYRMKSRLEGIP